MKLRVRYNHWLPKRLGVQGIVLFPFVLFDRQAEQLSLSVRRHEMIHVRQVRRLGVLKFYAFYVFEYLGHLWRHRDHRQAYLDISFEREAYQGQGHVHLSPVEEREIGLRGFASASGSNGDVTEV